MNRTTAAATAVSFASLALVGCAADDTNSSGDLSEATVIVPTDPGGGQDLMGRTIAAALEETNDDLTVTVENRPGGSTVTGYSSLLSEKGDPAFLATATTGLISMPLTTSTPYTWESFTPIAMIGEDVELAVVAGDAQYEDLQDVVEAAGIGDVNVAVAGATGPDAIVTSLLEETADVTFNEIVFQSGSESVAAVLSGDADMLMTNPSEVLGQLESGDLKAIAMFSDERLENSELLAEVATAQEQGLDVTFSMFRALIAPGGLSEDSTTFWVDKLREWTETDGYQTYVEENSIRPLFTSGEELDDYLTQYEDMLREVLG